MPYRVEVRLQEEDKEKELMEYWAPVIDLQLSRTKTVPRIFLSKESAEAYVRQDKAGTGKEYRIVTAEE